LTAVRRTKFHKLIFIDDRSLPKLIQTSRLPNDCFTVKDAAYHGRCVSRERPDTSGIDPSRLFHCRCAIDLYLRPRRL
jgi:hypothetical protein